MKILLTHTGAPIVIAQCAIVIALAACSPSRPTATAPPESVIASPIISSPTPTPTVTGDPFAKGVDKAASATSLAQSAQTPEDWNLVLAQWQRAIAFMKAVPTSSPNHAAAQKLLPSYQQNLLRAQQQAKRGGSSGVSIASKNRTDDGGIPIISGEQSAASTDTAKDTATTAAATVTALLQQQTEFFAKQKRYATSLAELGGTIPADTPTYAYSTSVLQSKQVIATATAKQDGLPSYTGALFTLKDDKNAETTTTTVCLTSKPSKTPPAVPQLIGKDAQCPSGASKV